MAPTIVKNNSDTVLLVTGANRGLGVEHVKQFLKQSKVKVVATARQPAQADELNSLLKENKDRLSVIKLDTGNEESIEVQNAAYRCEQRCLFIPMPVTAVKDAHLDVVSVQSAAKEVARLHPEGIDLILNNAGTQEPFSRAIETYAKLIACYNVCTSVDFLCFLAMESILALSS